MISFCLIGKNKESVLEKCLSALEPYGHEIVTEFDKAETEKLILKYPNFVGRLLRVDTYDREIGNRGDVDHYASNIRISRLFSKEKYRYSGSIHEQVVLLDFYCSEVTG